MKKLILPLALLLIASACTPRDIAVVSPDQRDKLTEKKFGAASVPGEVKQLGSYGFAAFLMEKQGEVLQILSVSNLERSQASGPYTVDEATPNKSFQKLILSAKDFTISMPNFAIVQNAKWKSIIERSEDNAILSVDATSISESGSIQEMTATENSQLKDQGVTLTEKNASISVVRAADEATSSDVIYTSNGSVLVSKGGTTEILPFDIKIKMRVKTNTFQETSFDITKSEMSIKALRRSGEGKPLDATVKIRDGEVVQFKNDKDCPLILGQAEIIPNKKMVIFDAEAATIGSTYKTVHASCDDQRPTVDLSRILVY